MGGLARAVILMLTLGLVAWGPGCGVLRRKARPADTGFMRDMKEGRRPMGQVVLVEAAGGFVVVQSPLASVTPPEAALVVRAQGSVAATGRLKVTPERQKNRFAADIVEGAPKVGEVVYFPSNEKLVSTAPPAAEPGVGASGAVPGVPGVPGVPVPGVPVPGVPVPGVPEPGVPGGAGEPAGWVLPPLGEPSGPREVVPGFPDGDQWSDGAGEVEP